MSLWKRLFGTKNSEASKQGSDGAATNSPITSATSSVRGGNPVAPSFNRRIRVFISSTFRDMIEEREVMMTHAWPELRRFCQERQVELVEVDLRWGIPEEQSTRKETLKGCLDEVQACRPFFLGLLGERYGWVPGDEAFTADLREEQPWLRDLYGKSVTELEILHGVLNNPEMAKYAFFFFRDPRYVESMPSDRRPDFTAENAEHAERQRKLKELIKQTCAAKHIPLHEGYRDPRQLGTLVLEALKPTIEAQFPKANVPDDITREARDHEAFAEIRRRTYIARADYFSALDRHAMAGDRSPYGRGQAGEKPIILLGDSGSGKSALLSNWIERWRKDHPGDFIFQHYIGSTPESAQHWRLMTRLITEIKRWTGDPDELPRTRDDLLKTFPIWLAKARLKADRDAVNCIVVLDALNQLEDRDHAKSLGWLPAYPFTGSLRLIVSTLPGDTLKAVEERRWGSLHVQPLTPDERRRMIADYLARFGKKLDGLRLERLAAATATANPLYLKILLDDVRVTGSHEFLDQRLAEYLAASDIPTLLQQVLARYRRDYERERPGLVAEALGLINVARRGLSETELLQLLRPADQAQLPPALWTPLGAALEESLVDRGGILNFAHDFFHTAVSNTFVLDEERRNKLRLQLADYFEAQPITARSCDELPWLLKETGSLARLHACLLNINRFLVIYERDEGELRRYWVESLQEQQTMGKAYLASFQRWSREHEHEKPRITHATNRLGVFLFDLSLHAEAEPLMRRALESVERSSGKDDPQVADLLSNLAMLLLNTNRLAEAESLMRRALHIYESRPGSDRNVAVHLNNLAQVLKGSNQLAEAEPLMRRALDIDEHYLGPDHPNVARDLINLAQLLQDTNRLAEAERLMRRALDIDEHSYGKDHPDVARDLIDLAALLQVDNRFTEAEPLLRRGLDIDEHSYGKDNPNVATCLNNLAQLFYHTNRLAEAEPLMRRALDIDERSFGKDHPKVATSLNGLALLLQDTGQLAEAEPLMRRALHIDEHSLGSDHPKVAIRLNNLAWLLQSSNRLAEAEPLMRRMVEIHVKFAVATKHPHPHLGFVIDNYGRLLKAMGRSEEEIMTTLRGMAPENKGFVFNVKPH